MNDVNRVRQAIIEAIPSTTSNYGEASDLGKVYVPPSHLKALRLDCNVVIGARGVGKSFWATALRSEAVRTQIGSAISDLAKSDVYAGFGVQADIDAFPDGDSFSHLLGIGIAPYDVWRGVISRWLSKILGEPISAASWQSTIEGVVTQPEAFARLLQRADRHLAAIGRTGLIIFDALDRTSSDWHMMDRIVRDLLRVMLLLKSYPRLHSKVFLRVDQYGRTITDFPDASKLLAGRVELTWAGHDLHGLLWQYFCNAPTQFGECLRSIYEEKTGQPPIQQAAAWRLTEDAKRESSAQRNLFETLAGPWMGRDRRRGVPYIWSVSHLADGQGQTSPRSFLAAIRAAAEDSRERYPDYSFPLHYESIKRGVQKASEIRVAEMAEDYPWVTKLMQPLRGMTVPCYVELIEERWGTEFSGGPQVVPFERLPPQHFDEGWFGVRSDLERLGIFETMKDGRINMPDLYRVGFGLGRRGGVKPAGVRR